MNIIQSGTLYSRGHLVSFRILFDDTVIIEEEFNDVRETDRIPIDDAMQRQVALLEMDYQWV
tara:strand:- start:254 stop:439 length:186 start_codon:yes stop_codon:yes gene_type:complete